MRSFLYARFWDRWIANGIAATTVAELRKRVIGLEDWIRILNKHANFHEQQALSCLNQGLVSNAESLYRLAGLHFSLIQWMFPESGDERRLWYARCQDMHRQADALAVDEIISVAIQVDGCDCYGRIRVPERPKGCLILLNPVDCSKEELLTHEEYFAEMGFVTMIFDGPGQGETYIFDRYLASLHRWRIFLNQIIEFAVLRYPELNLYLFGNSSGATWVMQGSSDPRICRAVAVSPIIERELKIPDYVKERLAHLMEGHEISLLPSLDNLDKLCPILWVHGKKDILAKDAQLYEWFDKLPSEKRLIEYVDEGHCCDYKRTEILKAAADWFGVEL